MFEFCCWCPLSCLFRAFFVPCCHPVAFLCQFSLCGFFRRLTGVSARARILACVLAYSEFLRNISRVFFWTRCCVWCCTYGVSVCVHMCEHWAYKLQHIHIGMMNVIINISMVYWCVNHPSIWVCAPTPRRCSGVFLSYGILCCTSVWCSVNWELRMYCIGLYLNVNMHDTIGSPVYEC